MARGRPPKPTRLKELEGNPGKRPLNKKEPRFAAGSTEPPPHLDEEAKAEWARVAPQLAAQKMLTIVDRAQLTVYCTAYSRWLKAEKKVRESDELTFETPAGYKQQLAEIGIAHKYAQLMIKIAGEFGFSPAARVRMSVKPLEGEGTEDDRFFGFKGEGDGQAAGDRLPS